MGLTIQTERRAAEAVFQKVIFSQQISQKYHLAGKEIFLSGISLGIGTCADLHKVNIAVFEYRQKPKRQLSGPVNLINCSGAVLIRSRQENDPIASIYPEQVPICLVAESLLIERVADDEMYFRSGGTRRVFVPLE